MKLNVKRTLLVGLAFISISAFWQLNDSVRHGDSKPEKPQSKLEAFQTED
jgi:hypothetical protein